MRRTCSYAAVTKDAAQRSIWTFYETVNPWKEKSLEKKQSKALEYLKAVGTALVLALIIRTYVVQAFKIPSGSMIPTLLIGDHLLVNKFLYGTPVPFTDKKILTITQPKRGDIVVFKYPED